MLKLHGMVADWKNYNNMMERSVDMVHNLVKMERKLERAGGGAL